MRGVCNPGDRMTEAPRQGTNWPDLSGRVGEAGHVLPVRVYFEDTDFSGSCYHATYLRWCERGRSDFLRLLGVHHNKLADGSLTGEPSVFAVRRLKAEFLRAARIDEELEVHTDYGTFTKATIILTQHILRGGERVFELEVQCVLLSLSGRVLRLPPALAAQLTR
ncbi:thioesterase superfamily protein [Rhodomicrobium vannielii ATCC 17100]|uniref:Thioesterase superfamily protein n=2 Tax=Rhodomicrobium vannielii TaxID=1069 RepID=E3I1D1_RHOVT|nr:thioesterase superfamily protein [Rhodomicrobium vannielii ATCC 17100]